MSVCPRSERTLRWVRLLWSEAGAVCDLGFCASLDRLKGSSPLRSWVLRPGREKGAVPGYAQQQEGRGRGVRPVPGAVRALGGGLEDPGHAASSATYGSRTVTLWHDQVTPEEPHPTPIASSRKRPDVPPREPHPIDKPHPPRPCSTSAACAHPYPAARSPE